MKLSQSFICFMNLSPFFFFYLLFCFKGLTHERGIGAAIGLTVGIIAVTVMIVVWIYMGLCGCCICNTERNNFPPLKPKGTP